MYKFLYAFALLCSAPTFSQTLDGFMGIKFGSSAETVKKIVLNKPGAKIHVDKTATNILFFKGLKFTGREIVLMGFSFINNQFHTAILGFKPKLSGQVVDLYEEIKKEINEKYFITDMDYEEYKYPFDKRDDLTEYAIQAGKANFSAYWKFQNSSSSEPDYISLEITEDLRIDLKYQNGALAKLLATKQKSENSKDY